MARHVTGIGGFFFRADDHKALAKWYNKHFGINDEEHGWTWQQDAGPTVFSPFKRDTDYFGNDEQAFMLNLRVQDLDGLLKKLEADGVRIDPKHMDEDYGRFAWVYDPEGNKVEQWEPYFSWGFALTDPAAQHGQRVRIYYDALGRPRRTMNPDGTEQRVVYGMPNALNTPDNFKPSPWERYTYDANDLADLTHPEDTTVPPEHRWTPKSEVVDALGHTVRTTEHKAHYNQQVSPAVYEDDVIARIPKSWTWGPQERGLGIRFFDDAGMERIRMHGPSAKAPAGSNSASGWTLRVMEENSGKGFYTSSGQLVDKFANEGHIPLAGNPLSPR